MLELKLLGVPEVKLGGRSVVLRRRRSISLLAYLALTQRAYAREVLEWLLCGDSPANRAHKLVSNLLVDLHRELSAYVVTMRGGMVSFDTSLPYAVDIVDFSARAARCDSSSSQEDL